MRSGFFNAVCALRFTRCGLRVAFGAIITDFWRGLTRGCVWVIFIVADFIGVVHCYFALFGLHCHFEFVLRR